MRLSAALIKLSGRGQTTQTDRLSYWNSRGAKSFSLERVRGIIRRSLLPLRERMVPIAMTLAEETALYNDPNRINNNTEPEKRLTVTAAEIQKAAKAWLKTSNRVVMVTYPGTQ